MGDGWWECLVERMDEFAVLEPELSEDEQWAELHRIADEFTHGDVMLLRKVLKENQP